MGNIKNAWAADVVAGNVHSTIQWEEREEREIGGIAFDPELANVYHICAVYIYMYMRTMHIRVSTYNAESLFMWINKVWDISESPILIPKFFHELAIVILLLIFALQPLRRLN